MYSKKLVARTESESGFNECNQWGFTWHHSDSFDQFVLVMEKLLQGSRKGPGILPGLHVVCRSGEDLWPGSSRDVSREYEVGGSLLRAIKSLYLRSESCVWVLSSHIHCWWRLASAMAALCHQSCLWFSWTAFRNVVVGGEGCSSVHRDSHCCFLQMMWSSGHLWSVTFSAHWMPLVCSRVRRS